MPPDLGVCGEGGGEPLAGPPTGGYFVAFGGTGSPLSPGEEREIVTVGGGPNRDGTWTARAGPHLGSYLIDDQDHCPEETSKTNNAGDQLLVVGATGQGLLQANSECTPGSVDLTQEGTENWVQWGLRTPDDVNRKTGANRIGPLLRLGEGAFAQTSGFGVRTTWSANAAFWTNHVGSGYAFDVPADITERVLKVYAQQRTRKLGRGTRRICRRLYRPLPRGVAQPAPACGVQAG